MDDRAWIWCTKWTGNEALDLVEKAANTLHILGYDIDLVKNTRSGLGKTQLNNDGSLSYEIGIDEILKKPLSRFPINEALAPTVACFHEVFGHGGQWENENRKDKPLSKILLLNDLACKCSAQFYGFDPYCTNPESHYFEQPHEIAAQYMGLKMTQKFLSACYGTEKANKLLCEYVNLRIAKKSEFIKPPDTYHMEIPADGRRPYMKPTEPFATMSQVYNEFQKTFIKQVFKPVDYTVTKESVDYVEQYIKNQKWPWTRTQLRNQVNQIDDRLTQAYVLSGIWLNQHEYGQWIKDLPALRDIEFPNTIPRLIENTPEYPDPKDLDLNLLTEENIDFTKAVEALGTDTGQSL